MIVQRGVELKPDARGSAAANDYGVLLQYRTATSLVVLCCCLQ